jgi:peptidoglycan hydrolase CwlO-like protein
MANKQIDAESLVDNLQNAKFGLSIQNIVAIVTVLSSLIAGWYTFTGRIDSLEEVVQGFAETSDIELVGQKLDSFEKQIDYLTEKIDSYEGVDLSDIKGDIAGLKGDVKSFNNAIKALDTKIEEFHGDPLAKFKK